MIQPGSGIFPDIVTSSQSGRTAIVRMRGLSIFASHDCAPALERCIAGSFVNRRNAVALDQCPARDREKFPIISGINAME
jgi:hypothetical protein